MSKNIALITGVTGQVTHPGMIVKTVVGSLYTKEVENKTILLQTILDKKVIDADSNKVPEEFDGVFAQHVAGITGADYIVAINKDEDASIFDIANVGIVGNLLEVVPVLTAEVKKLKG